MSDRSDPKPNRVSFNQWLTLQSSPDNPHAAVAAAWKTTRGRLTRAAVVERAGEAGGVAYDAYLEAVKPLT